MSLLSRMRKPQEAPPAPVTGMSATELAIFQRVLYEQSGIVLKDNKRALVESRVNQRLRALGLAGYPEYLELLRADRSGEELVHLIDVISTNVTQFFREPDHFTKLAEVVDGWGEQGLKRLRFWSAACSTGEEPYTMAMTLAPLVRQHGLDAKILATDISTRVLAHAQRGVFPVDRLGGVSPELRRRWFTEREENGRAVAEVSNELRQMIMYRRLNFTKQPFPIKGIFDVILCRNAMIYFDRHLRTSMVAEFARLLRPGGYLMIGHSETLIGIEGSFRSLKSSVYQRLNPGVAS